MFKCVQISVVNGIVPPFKMDYIESTSRKNMVLKSDSYGEQHKVVQVIVGIGTMATSGLK